MNPWSVIPADMGLELAHAYGVYKQLMTEKIKIHPQFTAASLGTA